MARKTGRLKSNTLPRRSAEHRVFTATTMYNLLIVFKSFVLEILQRLFLAWAGRIRKGTVRC